MVTGRVFIIGAGNVGSSIAYSILNQEIASEIVLIDIDKDLAQAQVLDMQDATSFTQNVIIKTGDYSDLLDGDIVVITCGSAQKEGETRMDLLSKNTLIVRSVIAEIKKTNKKVFICMVTNPVDVLTYIAISESGLPNQMVFGSGTYLDSTRLKVLLRDILDINHHNIHAYVLGEHGDTSFAALSCANISGIPLSDLVDIEEIRPAIQSEIRNKAYEIIKGKKATYYGIGNTVAEICSFIIGDEKRIIPLCVLAEGIYGLNDVAISMPVKISANGVEPVVELRLNEAELDLYKESAEKIKEARRMRV